VKSSSPRIEAASSSVRPMSKTSIGSVIIFGRSLLHRGRLADGSARGASSHGGAGGAMEPQRERNSPSAHAVQRAP
jgi:hypothetical protein